MHIFFLALTLCIYPTNCCAYEQDWSDFNPNDDVLGENLDLFTSAAPSESDLWDISPVSSINSGDELFLVDSNPCDSLLNPLRRRAGETCTNPKSSVDVPGIQIRPLGTTKDTPLLPTKSNYYLCLPDLLGYSRNFAMCDSGFDSDIHDTSTLGVFDLSNCDICTSISNSFGSNHADSPAVDILRGCFTPRRVWCCGEINFQLPRDQRVCLIATC